MTAEAAADDVEICDNPDRQRYELRLAGRLVGLADYVRRGDVVSIPHTETVPAFGGRGYASRLVRFALDDLDARGLKVDPVCPFVDEYLRRNPSYKRLRA